MVKLKFKSKDDKKVEYYYQPECKGEWGIVSMDFTTRKINADLRAESDYEGSKIYTSMCAAELRKYIDANNFIKEKTIIWY